MPRVSEQPGFVNGYWTRKDNSGLSMILFESEDAAKQASERVPGAVPEGLLSRASRCARWSATLNSSTHRWPGLDRHRVVPPLEFVLSCFAQHGIEAKRLMTDNAFTYVHNRSLRELLTDSGIHHLTTKPYRPRTNGKVERFHQTRAREWAYGPSYRSHRHRNRALPHWLDHYNKTRPHSSLAGRPPISRDHNLRGQDT